MIKKRNICIYPLTKLRFGLIVDAVELFFFIVEKKDSATALSNGEPGFEKDCFTWR